MIGVAVNWLLLMVLVMNNQNVGLRYANPTYQFFNHDHYTNRKTKRGYTSQHPHHRQQTLLNRR